MGCKITYQKSHLVEPRPIRSPEDIRPGTKKGKLDHNPIWIVEVQMPKKLAFDIYKGYMNKMKNEYKETSGADNAGGTAPAPQAQAPGMPPAAPTAPAGAAPQPAM
jgi:hypothetical protein